jgi:hypothetical protein
MLLALTDDVLQLETWEEEAGGGAVLVLRNDDGRYNDPGTDSLALLRRGSQVRISPGYHTSQGTEVSDSPALWIAGWEHRRSAGRCTFHLHLDDGWAILEGWRARHQLAWAFGEATVQEILNSLLSKAGAGLTVLSSSSTFASHQPDFTVHPGENGATAVRRLMAMVPDAFFFREAKGCVKFLQTSDPTDYAYGTGHMILEGRYTSTLGTYNRVQAYGLGVTGEAFAWTEVEEAYDRLLQVHDRNLDTQAKAQERAQALIQKAGRSATAEFVVPVNCGQELYDVLEVSDPYLGIDAARYRVLGLSLRYDTLREPRYTHTLRLIGE